MRVRVYVHVCVHARTRACMYECMCAFVRAGVRVCVYATKTTTIGILKINQIVTRKMSNTVYLEKEISRNYIAVSIININILRTLSVNVFHLKISALVAIK